ncbi:hypothetical protein AB0I72_13160 [Nocardiopsis sp. NPDC049922]|uniref:hypothetical protein n=1 Tax=Nocardiopsis sp. NPDC049922 TaxID=3155157 RepID=UPI0033FCAFE4
MPRTVVTDIISPVGGVSQPFGLTRCTAPAPEASYDVSGIDYDTDSQMSVRDGSPLIEQPILGTAVQCTVTTTEDMQTWTDQIEDE